MSRLQHASPAVRALAAAAMIIIVSGAVAGCAVGPNFKQPAPPAVDRYTETPLPSETASAEGKGGAAQRFFSDRDIPAEWWTLFHSEPLDRLIRQALADSPTIAAAEATLREAQENLRAEVGGVLFPSVDAVLSARRQQTTGAAFGQPNAKGSLYNLFNASVGVSYSLDLFGGARRELEALRSQVDYQHFQLEGAHLALTSNIITTAVKEASLREQILTTQEILKDLATQLDLVERQFQLGGASRSDVLIQRALLAQTQATLPLLELELAQTRHLLAVLVGRLPGEATLPEFDLNTLELPQELPVSLPSSLVRQRPDILASEALYHQASAQIGVATAALFPQVTLTGSYGSQAAKTGDLFTGPASIWSLGASLLQPILRGGQLTAQRRAAIDAYDQAAAQYRQAVLMAFQNVADVLRALEYDAKLLKAQTEAEAAARASLELTQKQFELGAVNYLSLLNAQRQHRLTVGLLIQARARRYADTAALFQALGGGWWNRGGPLPPVAPTAASVK
jgi:NodT family efflux transporter outer membrane factor (OMF) lipoprotein